VQLDVQPDGPVDPRFGRPASRWQRGAVGERSRATDRDWEDGPMDGDYEDVTMYTLDADVEEQLLLAHNECTFIWSNREGWPIGVIMSYVWRRDAFWLTASAQRARIAAVRRDPRVCVVVTSTGSPLPRNKAVTWKGTCTVHEDGETKEWFYGELAAALNPGRPDRAEQFRRFLDSPRRVVLEVTPTQRIGYDGAKMRTATAEFLSHEP
jgi:nitroimidazol reductase NimA-like FMN-containing flavoprotein (pyridoxamine 5'-phosphate oxidase superfamily)